MTILKFIFKWFWLFAIGSATLFLVIDYIIDVIQYFTKKRPFDEGDKFFTALLICLVIVGSFIYFVITTCE